MTHPGSPGSPPGSSGHAAGATHHVVLVGLSGSGKSTIGRRIATRLGRPFVDTDDLIVALAGRPIPEVFAQQGEAAFREIERRAVAAALAGPPAVIATGGGAPMDATNRAALWDGHLVVWLDAPVATLVRRVGEGGPGRPLLAGGAAARLTELRAARRPVYATAHLHLDSGRLTIDGVAAAVLAHLARLAQQPPPAPPAHSEARPERGTDER